MKILFLTENFPPESNAAASRVYERACYWQRWGHQVTVLTTAPNFPEGKLFPGYRNRWRQVETIDGIRVVRVKTYIAPNRGVVRRTLDFLSFLPAAVSGGCLERRPDIVIATSPQFFAAVAGWLLAAIRRRPFVFELGDLWPASISAVGVMRPNLALRLIEQLELFLYRRAAAVIALTRSFKDDLVRRGIAADKIAVVINGVDLPRYAERERDEALRQSLAPHGELVLGYIGTLGLAHGLENALHAMADPRLARGVRLLLVGAGAAREGLMQLARELGLQNVHFVPRQPKADMPRYWGACDVALVHLKDDPVFAGVIPSKMFEAMGMGLPLLLVAPEGEASAILRDSAAGLLVPPSQPHLLATAIERLRDDTPLRTQLAQASTAAAPRYSRERQARDVLAVCQRVLDGAGASAARAVES